VGQSHQDGAPVPGDLILLVPDDRELTEAELRAIDALDWYEAEALPEHILVSASALGNALQGGPLDDPWTPADLGLSELGTVVYIAGFLHRWEGGADGLRFYHA
jgi:hypothetical protein